MIRLLKIFFLIIFFTSSALAGSDGDLQLSKKSKSTKDCFEPLNRATFALNQGLDSLVFEPLASGYKLLPSPVKTGTSNALSNLQILLPIPLILDMQHE